MRIICCKVLVLLLLAMFLANVTHAISIKSKGEVRYFPLDGKGNVLNDIGRYTTPFSILLSDDGRFFMQIERMIGGTNIFFTHDGLAYFFVTTSSTYSSSAENIEVAEAADFDEIKKQLGEPKGTATHATLTAEAMPFAGHSDLWYALCSGHFFRKHGTNGEIVNLFKDARYDIGAYGFRYEADLIGTAFPFVRRLEIFWDSEYQKKTFREAQLRETMSLWNYNSADQKMEWNLRSDGTLKEGERANALGWRRSQRLGEHLLPLEIMITNYFMYPHPTQPQMRTEIYLEDWEYVNDQDENDDFEYQPPIESRMMVSDWRLRKRDAMHYVDYVNYFLDTTNVTWPSTNEVWLQEMFDMEMSMNIRPDRKLSKGVLMTMLFAAMISAMLLFVKKTLRNKRRDILL